MPSSLTLPLIGAAPAQGNVVEAPFATNDNGTAELKIGLPTLDNCGAMRPTNISLPVLSGVGLTRLEPALSTPWLVAWCGTSALKLKAQSEARADNFSNRVDAHLVREAGSRVCVEIAFISLTTNDKVC